MHYKRASDPLPFSNSIKMVACLAWPQHLNTISQGAGRAEKFWENAAGKVGAASEHPGSQPDTNLT